jgi:hypothetical protein
VGGRRWLEPRLPDWLTRAVLGSAKTPVYPGKHEAGSQVPTVNPEHHLTADTGEQARD